MSDCITNDALLAEIPGPAITVYCASSSQINGEYFDAARQLGRFLAEAGYTVVNGGGDTGLMGALNDGCLEAGGRAVGIIPKFMVDRGWGHKGLTKMIVARDMHQRKELMAACAKSVIALPGGIGTFEELMEIMTWRQLGLYTGKVVVLNVRGYYESLLALLDKADTEGFLRRGGAARQLLWLAESVLSAVDEATTPIAESSF